MKNYLLLFASLLIFLHGIGQTHHGIKELELQTDSLLHIKGSRIKHYYESMCQLYTYGPHQFLRCDGGDFMIGCPASYLVRQDSLGAHRSHHAVYFKSPDSKITIFPANYAACFEKKIDPIFQFEKQRWQKEGWKLSNAVLVKSFFLIEASKNDKRLYKKVVCKLDRDCLFIKEVTIYFSKESYTEAQHVINTYVSKFPDKPF